MNEFTPDFSFAGSRQAPTSPYGMYGGAGATPQYPYGMPAYPQQPLQQQPQQVFPPQPSGAVIPGVPGPSPGVQVPGMLPIEQSFIENILRLNKGKTGTFYFTYENNNEWNAKIYRGVIEAAGRDHIILSDPATGKRYLLLMVNFDYAEFDEPLNYEYPFGSAPRPIRPR